MREHIKQAGYRALLSPLRHRAERRNACITLCYHRFEERIGTDPVPGMAVTPGYFRDQILALQEMGPFVSVDDLIAGRTPPGLSFCLTFDDGYRDNLTILLPILEELQVPCCIYITSGFVEGLFKAFAHDRSAGYQPPSLSAAHLRSLAGSRWVTIGAHTRTHPNLGIHRPGDWPAELAGARQWLEDQVQQPVVHFAYPFGQAGDLDWDAATSELPAAGYVSVASNFGGMNTPRYIEKIVRDSRSLTHIRRVPVAASADRSIYLGWALGLCNIREMWKSRPCLK